MVEIACIAFNVTIYLLIVIALWGGWWLLKDIRGRGERKLFSGFEWGMILGVGMIPVVNIFVCLYVIMVLWNFED